MEVLRKKLEETDTDVLRMLGYLIELLMNADVDAVSFGKRSISDE